MTTLFVVEAPGKVKKLQGFLGGGYKVVASAGHIRDLPQKKMGVEGPDWVPDYEVTKADVVKRLKGANKESGDVIIATDLDREGEAIAFHIAAVLGLKNPKRVTYCEITKKALQEALAAPRTINMDLVRAQEARRVVDRLVGYRVSGALSQIAGTGLSAGRVQTPAIMIVVAREREIRSFVSTSHFGVRAHFLSEGKAWYADWDFKPLLTDKEQKYWLDEEFAKQLVGLKNFSIQKIEKKEVKQQPPPPFTTSTLQQAASSALGLKPKQTMELAQSLYEAGLITYHRTDSMMMSQDAVQSIWEQLRVMGMANCIPDAGNAWKAKENAQEAHECIRPTHFEEKSPSGDASAAALRLYELIWCRAMACQMKPQVLDTTTVHLLTDAKASGYNDLQQRFVARGRVERFAGWRAIYQQQEEEKDDSQPLPALAEGMNCAAEKMELQAKKTQPPPRYTEASLIKKLEDEGVGRPSTYASIIDTLYRREYVREEKKKLVPTEIAFKVVDSLVGRFEFAALSYTRKIEEDFDLIAHGKKTYKGLVSEVNGQLEQELKRLNGASAPDLAAPVYPCPAEGCEGRLRRAVAKNGSGKGNYFWACNRYPDCKETRPDDGGKPGERGGKPAGDERYPCPNCGKPMALRIGKKGKFWGCTGYPECSTIQEDSRGKPAPIHACPDCGKPLRKLKAKTGERKGSAFWACTGYKEGCKFTAPDEKGKPKPKTKA